MNQNEGERVRQFTVTLTGDAKALDKIDFAGAVHTLVNRPGHREGVCGTEQLQPGVFLRWSATDTHR